MVVTVQWRGATIGEIIPAENWTPRGLSLPAVGDTCLVVYDDQGDAFVPVWGGTTTFPTDNDGLTWQPFAYATGAGTGNWSDYGAGYPPGQYALDKAGLLHLGGLVKNGTAVTYPTTNTLIATLPAGYRPLYNMNLSAIYYDSSHNSGVTSLDVYTDGRVVMGGFDIAYNGGNTGSYLWLSLQMIPPFQQGN